MAKLQHSSAVVILVHVCSLPREPVYGYTPLMEAAASGHEIIVQYLLNHVSVLTVLCVAESFWLQPSEEPPQILHHAFFDSVLFAP